MSLPSGCFLVFLGLLFLSSPVYADEKEVEPKPVFSDKLIAKYKLAKTRLESEALSGDEQAMYERSTFFSSDLNDRLYWLEMAAENNHLKAQEELWSLYQFRFSNSEMSSFWRLKSAQNGSVRAMIVTADLAQLEDDFESVYKWRTKAANLGDVGSQTALGVYYWAGVGLVAPEPLKALEWFERAYEQGGAEAAYHLGLMYENGNGVRQDKNEAREFYGVSCDRKYLRGCEGFARLNEVNP